ncbi:MAG TPA: flagellar basal body-associated FliL family protein [Sedimentisphaerales bacterium]|nr:flagellar basal body-associated FliL family protein [Sedimentisphaerales bacterium]
MEKEKQTEQEKKTAPKEGVGKKKSILIWIVMLLVIIICAGAGLGIGNIFGSVSSTEETKTPEPEKTDPLKELTTKATDGNSNNSWYFELEPVIANLNEPGSTRYVMVTLIIEVSPEVNQLKGTEFLKEKSYPIKDWLTVYFAGLGLEDIQGDKNLNRIQAYLCQMLNEKLFPDAKPQLKRILFKELVIQ